ncbi:MAG: leucine-rich repeat domain-containing protein [Firmicutes bacterium]|nr:leucine-rich repeat domain-containing protein [Bacillota bacterium]
MMSEKELKIEGGTLSYRICEDEITVMSCHVTGRRVVLPDTIEALSVTKLEKKAFLSSKILEEIYLPKGLKEIGDWAFAYCSNLKKVALPKCQLVIGRGIFKECDALTDICHLEETGCRAEHMGKLLGAVPTKLEADYLFNPKEAGESIWFARFDDRLKEFLATPDEDGYTKMVYCGEEDIVANMDLYLAERRRAKSRLCFLRLMNDTELSDDFKEQLKAYLVSHTKGCASQASWEVVFKEHGNEQEYYEAFTNAGCLTDDNYDAILSEMGESYPEMKGYLMRYKSENMGENDFFGMLSLD